MFNYMQLDLIESMHNHYRNRYSGRHILYSDMCFNTSIIALVTCRHVTISEVSNLDCRVQEIQSIFSRQNLELNLIL